MARDRHTAGQAAALGLRILDVLEDAHRSGIVHRDVKPANVLMASRDRVKITDFGIAHLEGDPTLTPTGAALGSPSYMAPEQIRGLAGGPATPSPPSLPHPRRLPIGPGTGHRLSGWFLAWGW